ncbi:hypothetical protein GUJ93_ZPchr0001g33112 [Zizania palustris]|uniref:Uncharacterized protein n=1 Tax=Zizania palustris TaxID=103762 RepID=A0A8J5RHW7_ZIZPA|nr:hypothetical protein GUJ93_ZPchr0001g33112 [Zizania palustris]
MEKMSFEAALERLKAFDERSRRCTQASERLDKRTSPPEKRALGGATEHRPMPRAGSGGQRRKAAATKGKAATA